MSVRQQERELWILGLGDRIDRGALICSYLADGGFRARTASVDELEHERPLGIVLDISPHSTDGWGILTNIKSRLETRDIPVALSDLPPQMSYERAMLHYLFSHPGDYSGALQELPPKLLSMFVSAYQSYLFNRALSQRIDDGYSLTDPLAGDRLIFANGRTDTVTAEHLDGVATPDQCRNDRKSPKEGE